MQFVKGQVGVSRICKEGWLSFVSEFSNRNQYNLGEVFSYSSDLGLPINVWLWTPESA